MDRIRLIPILIFFVLLFSGCCEKADQAQKPQFSDGDIVSLVSDSDTTIGHVVSVFDDWGKWKVSVRLIETKEIKVFLPAELVVSRRSRGYR